MVCSVSLSLYLSLLWRASQFAAVNNFWIADGSETNHWIEKLEIRKRTDKTTSQRMKNEKQKHMETRLVKKKLTVDFNVQ